MTDLPLKSLGKYGIVREIGRGGMGIVYLGHDPFADRDVAIKVAFPESLQDPADGSRYRKLFFNEAKVAALLHHPNIIEVFDAGVDGEVGYIVMEYVAGGRSLHDHCRPDRLLPIEEVVRIVYKSARALDYAHRKGVVHRDVKPRNLLLTDPGELKISDFSVALMTGGEATNTQIFGYVGSPLYMSPEQVREEPVTNRTDIFSTGVVLYELLTGRHPFAADTLAGIVDQITRRQPPPLRELRADVPPVLAHIVERTLRKDPAARYGSGLDLAADLSLVFDHLKLLEDRVPNREKFRRARQLSFFSEFSDPEIWEVINASTWQDFEPGTEIIVEGQMDSAFYIIVAGEVEVRKRSRRVDVLAVGDCFGEMGFLGHRQRSATIIAREPVTALRVRASLIERASTQCQLRFHRVFLHALVDRLSRATEQMAGGPR
jgi:eukaryotic-like serine/threonine-protein kinase